MADSETSAAVVPPSFDDGVGAFNDDDVAQHFRQYDIDDSAFLTDVEGRGKCPRCGRSRKYFCYNCYVPLAEFADRIPRVKLPLKMSIIKHPREIDGKSTAVHAALIAPDDVNIHVYPCFPDFDPKTTVLVYPDKNAKSLSEIMASDDDHQQTNGRHSDAKRAKLSADDGDQQHTTVRHAVFVDSTWNQTNRILTDERLKNLRRVTLSRRETLFWRFQRGLSKECLATIEAIHQFVVEYQHVLDGGGEGGGSGDNGGGSCGDNRRFKTPVDSVLLDNCSGRCDGGGGGGDRCQKMPVGSGGGSGEVARQVDSETDGKCSPSLAASEAEKLTDSNGGDVGIMDNTGTKSIQRTYASNGASVVMSGADVRSVIKTSENSSRGVRFSDGAHSARDGELTHRYDNLLFFFKFMFAKIRTLYDPATLKAYQ